MLLTCSCFPFLGGTTTLTTLQFALQNWTSTLHIYAIAERRESLTNQLINCQTVRIK